MASGHDMAMALRAAYWAMHRRTEASLGQAGVTADQFVLLALLAQQDGITQQQLVRRAASDANTVRAMLLRLERHDLIARAAHPTDRRARSVTLTGKGREVYERLWADSEAVREQLLTALRPEETDTLIELLNRVCEVMATSRAGSKRKSQRPMAAIQA